MRLPTTLLLAFSGLVVSLLIGIPFGVIAALKPDSWVDRISMSIAVAGQAIPTFWMGLMLMVLFGLILRLTPISGDKLAALHFASVYFRILLNTADNEINKIWNVRSSLGRLYSNGLC